MSILRLTASLVCMLAFAATAAAQVSPPTPAAQTPPAENSAKKATPHALPKKNVAPAADPKSSATSPPPPADDPNADVVYGAYQRGQYKTALDLARPRAQAGDPKAMTMLGELYANALGVKRDDASAADWYKRAADAGDREAMFALAMMRIAGRGGPADRQEAVKLLASSA